MERYFIIVEGRVQGVGFRYFCQRLALELDLTGWARNMSNGMVEVEIQGSPEKIDIFISHMNKGNQFIRVDNYSLKRIEISHKDKSFRITY